MTALLAALAGLCLGVLLGALGGGGSILAVPVLVYLLDQSASQATTGSLVVVGVAALTGTVAAHRAGHVRLARGLVFGLVALGGTTAGAAASARVGDAVLMASFAALMLLVGGLMALRLVRERASGPAYDVDGRRAPLDGPVISLREGFACDCPRAAKLFLSATLVGALTGFLGVGGGFLVVPALVLVDALPMSEATGTSLVVITVMSAAALVVRTGDGSAPDWGLVTALTGASAVGAVAGARLARRVDTARLSLAFTGVVVAVGLYTAARALPELV